MDLRVVRNVVAQRERRGVSIHARLSALVLASIGAMLLCANTSQAEKSSGELIVKVNRDVIRQNIGHKGPFSRKNIEAAIKAFKNLLESGERPDVQRYIINALPELIMGIEFTEPRFEYEYRKSYCSVNDVHLKEFTVGPAFRLRLTAVLVLRDFQKADHDMVKALPALKKAIERIPSDTKSAKEIAGLIPKDALPKMSRAELYKLPVRLHEPLHWDLTHINYNRLMVDATIIWEFFGPDAHKALPIVVRWIKGDLPHSRIEDPLHDMRRCAIDVVADLGPQGKDLEEIRYELARISQFGEDPYTRMAARKALKRLSVE